MPRKKAETIAKETRNLRLEMHQLVSEGVSESDALVKILPDDNNRSTKLKLWKSLAGST